MKKPMQAKVKLLYPYKNHSHLDFFVLALIFSEVSEDVCIIMDTIWEFKYCVIVV